MVGLVEILLLLAFHASALDAAVAIFIDPDQGCPQLGDVLRERLRYVVTRDHLHVFVQLNFVVLVDMDLNGESTVVSDHEFCKTIWNMSDETHLHVANGRESLRALGNGTRLFLFPIMLLFHVVLQAPIGLEFDMTFRTLVPLFACVTTHV